MMQATILDSKNIVSNDSDTASETHASSDAPVPSKTTAGSLSTPLTATTTDTQGSTDHATTIAHSAEWATYLQDLYASCFHQYWQAKLAESQSHQSAATNKISQQQEIQRIFSKLGLSISKEYDR
jgi:hypothetical protein